MKNIISILILTLGCNFHAFSQLDSSYFKRVPADTAHIKLNMDAVYNRPFLQMGKLPVALGGYVEANSSYFGTDGVTEGLSFQLPRLTVFMSSSITTGIKFLSEIEFEEGGKEINIEFASMDLQLHPLLNLRGGVIMNPIGAFNQNHDGPKWEFVSRPVSSTTIIPSTWSNVGFGIFGKYALNNWIWAYEAYLTNGFDDQILYNENNKTWLPASKNNAERFEESFNCEPLVTLKTAIRHRKIGELGFSWMGGVYNKFNKDGVVIDAKRRVDLAAIDFNTTLPKTKTYINTEFVKAFIQVPGNVPEEYGNMQQGGYMDIVQPVLKRKILNWPTAVLNIAIRGDYADYNLGKFNSTGKKIGDEIWAITPGISFRPLQQTVIRANYRFMQQKDIIGNPPAITGGFEIGFSTYF